MQFKTETNAIPTNFILSLRNRAMFR